MKKFSFIKLYHNTYNSFICLGSTTINNKKNASPAVDTIRYLRRQSGSSGLYDLVMRRNNDKC